jgi:ATP-dependent protease HslVU (ClpYQ) ATPase subunit
MRSKRKKQEKNKNIAILKDTTTSKSASQQRLPKTHVPINAISSVDEKVSLNKDEIDKIFSKATTVSKRPVAKSAIEEDMNFKAKLSWSDDNGFSDSRGRQKKSNSFLDLIMII